MQVTSADVWRATANQHPGDGQFPRRSYFRLEAGDTAWNPASTKRVIDGPAFVEYREWSDGGVTAVVTPPTD